MNCLNCGTPLEENAKFCPVCGTVQPENVAANPEPVKEIDSAAPAGEYAAAAPIPPAPVPPAPIEMQAPHSFFVDYENTKMLSVLAVALCMLSSIAGIIIGGMEISKIKKLLPFADPERAAVLETARKISITAVVIGSVRVAFVVLYVVFVCALMMMPGVLYAIMEAF